MQAFRISDYGVAPAFAEVPLRAPGAGEVQIRIAACALNFADTLMIQGRYQERPEPPVTLGMELAGEVTAVGAGVTRFRPGDRVAAFGPQGGLAEAGSFPETHCVPLPDALHYDIAAALPVAHGTSHLALTHRAKLQPGETLLVLGAAGGVGLTAVEIGKRLGARVIACARGPERLAIASEKGADFLIDSDTDDIREAVKAEGGADVVYDPVGGDQYRAAFRALKPEARYLAIGFASGDIPQIPANHLLVKNITAIGLNWPGYMRFNPAALTDSLSELMHWAAEGTIAPHIGTRLPFSKAAEGLEMLKARDTTGKIVITMD